MGDAPLLVKPVASPALPAMPQAPSARFRAGPSAKPR